ncbi:MAG: hypothetical protein H0W68_02970 [Gemmatimonadaceae bacterium]|nr:hypothetical protein [Gemmatimonadaceae bacterium]
MLFKSGLMHVAIVLATVVLLVRFPGALGAPSSRMLPVVSSVLAIFALGYAFLQHRRSGDALGTRGAAAGMVGFAAVLVSSTSTDQRINMFFLVIGLAAVAVSVWYSVRSIRRNSLA